MSDYKKSTPRFPDREEIASAVELSYQAILVDLISAGNRLSELPDLVEQLHDGEFFGLPFLLSRQLEIVRMATRWIAQTLEQLKGGRHEQN